MLLDGRGAQFYDADIQRQYQARYTGAVSTLYSHPPFEAVAYLAVAWLPLKQAYLLWFVLNLAFLGISAWRMSADVLRGWDWRVLLAASFAFIPALLCLLQGQDSIVFLLFVVLAFTALRRGRTFAAGCWLGLGLCKFQVILPLAFVLVLTLAGRARTSFARGFGLVALGLAVLSAAISGWHVFLIYPRFLFSLQSQLSSGVAPQAMANFHGLVYVLFRGDKSALPIAAVSILSAAAFILVWRISSRARTAPFRNPSDTTQNNFESAFATIALFALLVSYYLNPHDLTLLLLPISLLLHQTATRITPISRRLQWTTVALLAILFLPPLHLWLLRAHLYALVAFPMLLLFLVTGSRLLRNETFPPALDIQKDQREN